MDPKDRRQKSFFEHLSDSERRLGARRHSFLDALVIGAIALIIIGGFTLGIMRLRTPAGLDQAKRPDTAAPVSASPAAPVSPPVSASPAAPARKEGLRTEKELEALKKQKPSR